MSCDVLSITLGKIFSRQHTEIFFLFFPLVCPNEIFTKMKGLMSGVEISHKTAFKRQRGCRNGQEGQATTLYRTSWSTA